MRREVNLLEVAALQSLEEAVRRFEEDQLHSRKPLQQAGAQFSETLRRGVEDYCFDASRKVKSMLELLQRSFQGLFMADSPQAGLLREAKQSPPSKPLLKSGLLASNLTSNLETLKIKTLQPAKMNFAKTQPVVLKDINFDALTINKIVFEKAKSKEQHSATKFRHLDEEHFSHTNEISRGTAAALGATPREENPAVNYMKDAMARLFGPSSSPSKGLLSTMQRPKSAQKAQTATNFLSRNPGASANPMAKSQHLFQTPPPHDSRQRAFPGKLPLENFNHHKVVRANAQVGTSRESNMFKNQILEMKQNFNKYIQRRKL